MGGEFTSLARTLRSDGIEIKYSCPYSSAQNGRVERKHRHIVETGLTLLAESGVPPKYWVDAFETAVFLIKKMATLILN